MLLKKLDYHFIFLFVVMCVFPSGPGWENGQKILWRFLTVLWPFSDLALLWLRTIKKHFKHCNYDSVAKFGIEGGGINTIILFFSDNTKFRHRIIISMFQMFILSFLAIIMRGQRTVRIFSNHSLNRVPCLLRVLPTLGAERRLFSWIFFLEVYIINIEMKIVRLNKYPITIHK